MLGFKEKDIAGRRREGGESGEYRRNVEEKKGKCRRDGGREGDF